MSTPQSAVAAAGVGATFHLFRLAADLISAASTRQAKEAAEAEQHKQKKKKDGDEAAPSALDASTGRRSTTRIFNGRLSVGGGLGAGGLGSSFAIRRGKRASLDDTGRSSAAGEGGFFDEADPEEEGADEYPKNCLERMIPTASAVIHAVLFAYFLSACVLSATASGGAAYRGAVYGAVPLGCCTVAVFLGIVMNVRDFSRTRLSCLQRLLTAVGCTILLVGCIVLLAFPPEGGSPTSVDWASLALLVAYTLLTLVEGRSCRYPAPKTKDGKKAHLSKEAILIILKPYFWPDATATSAALNRFRAALTWVCVGSAKACNLTAPILLGRASTALTRLDYPSCIRYSCMYAAVQFAGAFFKESQSLVYLKVAQAAFVQLSEVSFHHLHSLSLDWHLRKKLGEVIRSMDRGIAACDTLMKFLFLWLLPAMAECLLVVIIFATYFDYFPLSVAVFFFVFAYIIWTVLLTLWRKKFRKQVAKSDNDWHDRCTDSLVNFETVKYFTAEKYEMERFGESVIKYQQGSVNVAASLSALNISQSFLMQSCLATSLSLAALGIKQRMDCCVANGCDDGNSECCSSINSSICSGMEIGDFVTVLTYTLNLFMPLNFLGSVYNAIVMAIVDLTNLSELLAESPDVTDATDALPLPTSNVSDPDVAVEFDNVVFHYPTQPDTKGLKGMSFKMKKGTVTAVVGPTGAGKTTVSRLLFRFYDVLGGAVKVNGVDVRAMSQKSLREAIGVVPQATSLFNDTVRANIAYGKRDATDEDLERVAKDAQLLDFIKGLPDGWETMVGDRGLKLSGGEKQRTAIARCLLKDPPLVVLDEATSALDTVTENSVQDALDRLGSERTCLVIAHRLGTIRNADNIVVLGEGKVVEQGTHDELLGLNGKYAEMWNMQLHSSRNSSATNLSEVEKET